MLHRLLWPITSRKPLWQYTLAVSALVSGVVLTGCAILSGDIQLSGCQRTVLAGQEVTWQPLIHGANKNPVPTRLLGITIDDPSIRELIELNELTATLKAVTPGSTRVIVDAYDLTDDSSDYEKGYYTIEVVANASDLATIDKKCVMQDHQCIFDRLDAYPDPVTSPNSDMAQNAESM